MELKSKKTGIVVAMPEEAEFFIKKAKLKSIAQTPFLVYNHNNIFLIISGVGSVPAALATQSLITEHGCDYIISMGSCGATGNKFKIGDIVSVSRSFKRDVDLRVFGYEQYQLPGEPQYIPLVFDDNHIGSDCYSSDVFVVSGVETPKDIIVEMECFSVAFTCHKHGVKCTAYKIVSDLTDHNTDGSQFEENLKAVAQKLNEYVLSVITPNLVF